MQPFQCQVLQPPNSDSIDGHVRKLQNKITIYSNHSMKWSGNTFNIKKTPQLSIPLCRDVIMKNTSLDLQIRMSVTPSSMVLLKHICALRYCIQEASHSSTFFSRNFQRHSVFPFCLRMPLLNTFCKSSPEYFPQVPHLLMFLQAAVL